MRSNMKKSIIAVVLITFVTIAIFLLGFFVFKNTQYNDDIIYCNGSFDMKLRSGVSRGHILIEIRSDKTGFVVYRGNYMSKDKRKNVNFNRKILFSYKNIGESYVFESEGVVDFGDTLMGDINDEHYNLLPAFYKEKGEIYPVDVRKMSKNAFFLYDSLTLTYCSI